MLDVRKIKAELHSCLEVEDNILEFVVLDEGKGAPDFWLYVEENDWLLIKFKER